MNFDEYRGEAAYIYEFPRHAEHSEARPGRPYRELTAAVLPSSLTRNHPFALVFSTRLPVSVCGTVALQRTLEVFLGSMLPGIPSAETKGFRNAWANAAGIFLDNTLTQRTRIQ